MSFDRAYFVNTKAGFAKNVLHFTEKREDSCIILKYTVSEGGEYFLQYYTEPFAEVEIVSPINRYTPILHGEDKERLILLPGGESEVVIRISASQADEVTLYTRLISKEGRIMTPGYDDRDFDPPVYSDRREEYYADTEYISCPVPRKREVPEGYTPAVGADIDSYGRFGFAKGDGVLDYSMPAFGIISRPFISGMPKYKKTAIWSFSLLPDGECESGRNMKVYHTPENESIEVDWTHTCWRRELGGGKYISYDYSVVCPSLLIESNLDYLRLSRMSAIGAPASATICLENGEGVSRFVTRTVKDGILYSREEDGELKKNFVLLTNQGAFPEVPMLLTLSRSPDRIFRCADGIRVEFDGGFDFALLTFLYGIEVFDPSALTEEWYGEAIKKATLLHQVSLYRPAGCKEYFRLDGDRMRIFDKFKYKSLADSLGTPPVMMSPLPPPVMLEALYGGAAVADKEAVSLGIPTKYGPLYAVQSCDAAEYDLPVPEYRDRLVFDGKCKEKFAEMLHSDFDDFISYHRDRGYIPNPGNYSFLFQYAYPYKLFAYLKSEERNELCQIMREGLDVVTDPDAAYIGPNGRRCLSWYKRTEPFSGLSFLSTYLHITGISKYDHCDRDIIENSENVFIELDWGNAMSLYATWLSALFTGSFDKLERHFDIFRRAFDYYLCGMDFACMAVGYAENGVSWNDGTNYGGYLGFINIADALGRREEAELGLYAFAKLCSLRRGMFLSAQHYFYKYFGVDPWYITKFFHEETDGDCAFTSYPEELVRCGYRRQGIYNLTTEGHYREAFEMYAEYLPGEVRELLLGAEASAIGSITGKKIDTDTTYSTLKNGFLGEQETFSYLSLSTILGRFDESTLESMINEAAENRRISREILGHYGWSHRRLSREWSRIMLLSQLYARDQVALSAWRGLEISDATYPCVEITDVSPDAWIEVNSKREPRATLDGREITFLRLRRNIYRAAIAADGVLKFE